MRSEPGIADRLRFWWEENFTPAQRMALMVLVALLFIGLVIVNIPKGHDELVAIEEPEKKKTVTPPKEKEIMIHLAGAVLKPGVYKLSSETRVIDAVQAAGGFSENADPDQINLAAKVTDGSRIVIPQKSLLESLKTTEQTAGIPVENTEGASGTASTKVVLNSATEEQLNSLPGIGPAFSKRIIEYREKHGGFQRIEELQEIEGIGPKRFNQLKELVIIN